MVRAVFPKPHNTLRWGGYAAPTLPILLVSAATVGNFVAVVDDARVLAVLVVPFLIVVVFLWSTEGARAGRREIKGRVDAAADGPGQRARASCRPRVGRVARESAPAHAPARAGGSAQASWRSGASGARTVSSTRFYSWPRRSGTVPARGAGRCGAAKAAPKAPDIEAGGASWRSDP